MTAAHGPGLVLVTSSFPIRGDGSEAAGSFVSDLAEELAATLPVRVVAPGLGEGVERWGEGIKVYRYDAPDKPLSTLKPWQPAELQATLRLLRGGAQATRRAVAAASTAHILALWALPCGAWARSTSRATGIPYSVWTLGSDIWTLGKIPLVRQYLRRILRDARACYSDGLQLADDTAAVGGRAVEFLPSTRRIDTTRLQAARSQAPYRLLFLGRWHANKGADILLDALAQLDDADWTRIESVRIEGGGPLEPAVRAGVAGLQAKDRPVHLGGFLKKPEAEAAIASADWLLIPSRIESIPVVFSDAMKLRTPVISMPVGDLTALVGQEGVGVLSRAVDAASYAEAIRQAMQMNAGALDDRLADVASRFELKAIARQLGRSSLQIR
jgi:glycosyltransferase involved in cell wall biosynthesis